MMWNLYILKALRGPGGWGARLAASSGGMSELYRQYRKMQGMLSACVQTQTNRGGHETVRMELGRGRN